MKEARTGYRIGVDVGGTFTDLAVVDGEGGIRAVKAFSTPGAPEQGVFDVLDRAASVFHMPVKDILSKTDAFAHGTTVSTNALIERNGARVGALLTHGFEDTLAIGRGPVGRVGGLPQSSAMDFIHTEPPIPLVARNMVRGVFERIGSDGRVVVPLDEARLREAVRELLTSGAESLAVCLLWSFRNPVHERRVAAVAAEMTPGLPISLSCEIAPKMGEFERAVTTAVNAFVGPVTRNYVANLETGLSNMGLGGPLRIITSRGGAVRAENAGREAVSVINSGPAGGLIAARYLGDFLGHERIITADMGGTSFDVGLIDGDALEEEPRPFLDQGLPVLLPAARLVTIGAGGGSVAWTDGYGLRVGPRSAGADPGPAAYGRGGSEPTVTDALIVCGVIDPEFFFGGALDPDLAASAIADRIARPLGMTLHDAASGIVEVVNARMANLIRKVSIESGHDPDDFTLYAYGGATGAHFADFAKQLGIRKVVLPYAGPVFSALGVAIADIVHMHARSEPVPLCEEATAVANRNFRELEELARDDPGNRWILRRRIEMRHRDQMNEVTVDWPKEVMSDGDDATLRSLFETECERRFGSGVARPESPLELVSFRVDATLPTRRPTPAPLRFGKPEPGSRTRRIHMRGTGWIEAAVHEFGMLTPGTEIGGPAVIERDTTTIWLPAGVRATLDAYGNLAADTGDAR